MAKDQWLIKTVCLELIKLKLEEEIRNMVSWRFVMKLAESSLREFVAFDGIFLS